MRGIVNDFVSDWHGYTEEYPNWINTWIEAAMDAIDKMACDAKDMAERNSHRIEDCCKAIQLISKDTSEAYQLAAECRNELTRQHMIMRKETEK